ncbi:hypothetical protein [Lignipirellula cremea]|uniref:DUF3311 domain-containing protein n=1 Tax=Lignipirellula cremea TaxID=2528010 RepID=A0A518DQT9_9BACT|nr:hypothetical protein [Lignipirellula cremea]QDU94184.1 hypothetical protein Pla8534_19720 [Lignipirellula cremea]
MKKRHPMFYLVWFLVVLLIVLHQDFWLWGDATLYFGFLPSTLLYHVVLSLAAVATWWLATIYAWPVETIEAVKRETAGSSSDSRPSTPAQDAAE